MTSPEEDDSAKDESSTDQSEGNGSRESAANAELHNCHPAITDEEWDRLRAPFSRCAYVVSTRAIGRTERALPGGRDARKEDTRPEAPQEEGSQIDSSSRVVADLRLRARAIRDRLDLVVGPQRYSFRLEAAPDEGAERSVFCHLQIGAARRTGIGTGSSYQSARKLAIANAALAFGIGKSGKTAGPIIAGRESRYDVPSSILEALETGDDPSLWAPEEAS
jgi:hypothetical protein